MKKVLIAIAVAVAAALPTGAAADSVTVNGAAKPVQSPNNLSTVPPVAAYFPAPSNSPAGFNVGTTSAQVLAAESARSYLSINNESTTATVACAFGGAAAINSAGSFTIPAGATRVWTPGTAPQAAMNCIASAALTPITVSRF